uniref:Putative secreted protein n=1 Tax=Anopheles marajoara TaxID=58244 RepID=A0A2M4CAX6_9DIPT
MLVLYRQFRSMAASAVTLLLIHTVGPRWWSVRRAAVAATPAVPPASRSIARKSPICCTCAPSVRPPSSAGISTRSTSCITVPPPS